MSVRVSPQIFNEIGRIERVFVRRPQDAYVNDEAIRQQWKVLNYRDPPDLARAIAEYERFLSLMEDFGVAVAFLPRDKRLGLDSIYVRDAAVAMSGGMILGNMGKRARAAEPEVAAAHFRMLGIAIKGAIGSAGRLEGGDVVWLDRRTVAVGRGYRTNDKGVSELKGLLGSTVDVLVVPLPHWNGPTDVMHLMSLLSPVDRDLAVVYSPLLPVAFRQSLLARGLRLIEVPREEFDSLGCNVLTLAPRRCLMLKGNPQTRASLEREGVEVHEFEGTEIALKGGGGPTCLTLPIVRASDTEKQRQGTSNHYSAVCT